MTAVNSEAIEIEPTIALDVEKDSRGLGGLLALVEGVETPFPLRNVKVRANISGDCCYTMIEQHFLNDLDKVLEAIYIFPLPEEGAIVEMSLKAGDLEVRAECREREEANKIFEEARKAGHQAGLLTQERADIHTLRVTNLPPKSDVLVKIVVVERLEIVDGHWRWRFPTVIAPRYLPGTPIGHEGDGILPDSDHVPDASHLQPPLRLKGGTTLDLEVNIRGPIREIESSLHAIRLDLGDNGQDGIRIAPSGKATLNRDFVLSFSTANVSETGVRAYTDGAYTLVSVEPPSVDIPESLPRDAVFVIDRSGSMRGPKMGAAKLALKSALHGLQPGDRFMLISFSSNMQSYISGFTDYTQNTLDEADAWIDKIEAGGGTEILPAIKEALSEERLEGRSYTVLLITDGQVWNEAELVAAVANSREEARFFTIGIGTAVSAALLKRLARVGGGTCELLTPAEDIEAAIARLEARIGSPIAEDVLLEGGVPADEHPKSLFMGRPASWLLEGAPKRVTVKGVTATGTLNLEVKPTKIEFPLGSLWARERVSVLEDLITLNPSQEEAIRPEIIQIALLHQIASRFTAYVAVEKTRKATGERIEIVQPVELPMEWDPAFSGVPVRAQMKGRSLRSPEQYTLAASQRIMAMDIGDQLLPEREDRSRIKSKLEGYGHAPSKPASMTWDGQLARMQNANGSFGNDVKRTAAALISLVLLGHTRRKGIRQRTVLKAVDWLEAIDKMPAGSFALEALQMEEAGKPIKEFLRSRKKEAKELFIAGEEGKILKNLCDQLIEID